MREIKFRAWDTEEKRMIEEGLFIHNNGLIFHDEGDMGYLLKEIARKDRYIIMQFTGLKDKNGEEIYDEDIVIINIPMSVSKKKVRGKVICNVRSSQWQFENFKKSKAIEIDSTAHDYDDFNLSRFQDIEVIGNVYENPELLNKMEKE